MKKWKLYAAITVLVIMTGLLSFAVYAAINPTSGVANRTEFVTGDENVFVNISATYDGPPSITPNAETSYTFALDRNNSSAYEENKLNNRVWNVGRTNFVAHEYETITFTYNVENLNTANELNLTFSQIAVDFAQRFSTKIYVYDINTTPGEEPCTDLYAQDDTVKNVTAPTITLGKGESKIIKVEFKLLSYSEDFEFANNMKVLMETKPETPQE